MLCRGLRRWHIPNYCPISTSERGWKKTVDFFFQRTEKAMPNFSCNVIYASLRNLLSLFSNKLSTRRNRRNSEPFGKSCFSGKAILLGRQRVGEEYGGFSANEILPRRIFKISFLASPRLNCHVQTLAFLNSNPRGL